MSWSNPRVPFQMIDARPPLAAPGGKPIIVHLCMNVEYWPFHRPMPRGVIPAPHGAPASPPDVPNYSWVEYGLRVGMPRLMRLLADRGLTASAFVNAQVADVYPTLMATMVKADWELVGHGWFQQSLKQADDEAEVIVRSLAKLKQVSGKATRAWLGPGLGETEDTADLLKANGIEFLHDWPVDDLPFWIRTKYGPLLGLPYTFELNDVPIYAVQNNSTDELLKRLEATLAVFGEEAKTQPRILTFGLHPHIVGVPHIAHQFAQALDLLIARPDTVFMTSSQIGDWYMDQDPAARDAVDAVREPPAAPDD